MPKCQIIVGATVLSAAIVASQACEDRQQRERTLPQTWLVYLQNDLAEPTTIRGDEAGACAEAKFQEIWSHTHKIISRARQQEATIRLFASFESGTRELAGVSLNDNDPNIIEIKKGSGSKEDRKRDRDDRLTFLLQQLAGAEPAHRQLLERSPQHSQDLLRLVEHVRTTVPAASANHSRVMVYFVNDMVHYNTATAGQFDLNNGRLNMFDDRERRAFLAALDNPNWWIGDRPVTVFPAKVPVEVRTILTSRCERGDSIPGSDAPNLALLPGELRDIWTRVFERFGAKVTWNDQSS